MCTRQVRKQNHFTPGRRDLPPVVVNYASTYEIIEYENIHHVYCS